MKWKVVIGSILLSGFIASCWPQKPQVPSDLLRVTLGPRPVTWDWQLSQETQASLIALNIGQGLFTYDMDLSEVRVVPQLVDHFRHSDDFKQWTFCLKDSIRWGDGEPLRAQHVLDSWKRLLDPATGSPHAPRLYFIKGAKAFNQSQGEFSGVGLEVTDKGCLQVDLKVPVPFFSKVLTAPFTYPLRTDLARSSPGEWMLGPEVSLGPFYIAGHEGAEKTQLQVNPNYWDEKPQANQVDLYWIDDKATAMRLFRKKKLDVVKSPDQSLVVGMGLQTKYIFSPGVGLSYLGFNTQSPLGRQPEFRRAVKSIIFGPALESLVTDDGLPQQGLWPPFLAIKEENREEKPQAKVQSQAFRGKSLKIQSNFTPLNEKVISYVAYRLQRELGVDAKIEMKDSKSYFSELGESNPFTIYRASWVPALLDPHAYVDLLTSDSAQNFSFFKSEKLDGWIQQAAQEHRPEERKKLYDQIASWVLDDQALIIPLFLHKNAFLIEDSRWQYQPHFSERLPFSQFQRPVEL